MSQTEKNIAKHLIVGLIYPAVLGTLIYSLFDNIITSIIQQEAKGFLADAPKNLVFKSLLVLGTIGFYCCDFIYTIFTKDFKTRYFYFDLLILIGLSVTFKAININNNLPPNLNVILLSFMSFMFFYFLRLGSCLTKQYEG